MTETTLNNTHEAIKCQICGEIATHHHSGNHFCEQHAREYAKRAKWRRVLFWTTPQGAVEINGILEAI